MKKLLILNILIILLISCLGKQNQESEFYIETKASFSHLRHSDWTKNQWIRKPENLKMVHETFKRFGYKKLEGVILELNDEFIINDIYIKKNLDVLLDSLLLTYQNPKTVSKYYLEFWNRRISEKNDSIIYEIVNEFKTQRMKNKKLSIEGHSVNDTLLALLEVEFDYLPLSYQTQKKNFQTLKKFGFHQSAYNVLFQRTEYSELDLEKEKLKKELTKSTEFSYPWLIDTEK
ncbi:hypothetical protein SAMN04487910_4638 [Aquimarina amphilecti]|uniref:Lipoprotein n=1 Tax=Aquimarina amphilecti TaxID=1038014 RepID=A0A1H7X532_AQUAM|nr:hypothetical protein [Aquimarina amphilecti]SEM28956.1 hypothetical protein SAMN04487910_4638 [Aquimarina amphilecti]